MAQAGTPRMAIVVPYLKAGGTERQALRIQASADEHGVEARLVVIQRVGELLGEAPPARTDFLDTVFSRRNTPVMVTKLARQLRRGGFDLVLSRAWNSNVVTAAAARLAGIPAILYLSSNSRVDGRSRARIALERSIFSRARFVAVCQQAGENFRSGYDIDESRIRRIYNGVDMAALRELAEAELSPVDGGKRASVSIGFMGRLSPRKGLDILLDAARRVTAEGAALPDWEINVIGGGEERARLEAMARENRLPVVFHGERANPFPLLSRNDLFVLPSRAEGFPNALLEAMALGLPSIAADCETGPSEVICDGSNGYLFPVEDSGALAERLKMLMGDRDLRRRVGAAAAHTIAQDFSSQRQMREIFNLVHEMESR